MEGRYYKSILRCIKDNDASKKLYKSAGFAEIGRDEDAIIMELC